MGLATHVNMLYDSGEKDYQPISRHDVVADDILDTEHVYENPEYDDNPKLKDEIERMGVIVERSEGRL